MHLQVPPQNNPLLWQLNSHKHIGSIPELLRCCIIIVVTLNLMCVQVFRLPRKSHSLLDDPRNSMLFFISSKNGTNKNYRYLSVLRLILSVPIRLTKGKTEQKQLIHK